MTNEPDPNPYAPRPPSERAKEPKPPRGVGLFRLAGWGWGLTLALSLLVGVIVVVGYLREDAGRNPAPAAYRTAVCTAFEELSAGTRALEGGVEAGDDPEAVATAAEEVGRHVAAADEALTDLPEWEPGRTLDELIGSQIITLTNGAAALAERAAADPDLEIALEVDALGREGLADGRYGFDCAG
ncbi:MAG TPA: hypothetical protein VEW95_14140 [Candidatus Limnocylindrales bacterium]|nr:hypothetical protein [Candidatus Limnocylindrales bacterium]